MSETQGHGVTRGAKLGLAAGLIVFAAAVGLYVHWSRSNPVWSRIETHLQEADRKTDRLVEQALTGLDGFFRVCKQGTGPFVEDILSLKSKWCYITRSRETFDRFIAEAFHRHIFSPVQLKQASDSVIHIYLDSLKALENELLVQVRADLDDLPYKPSAWQLDDARFHQEFEKMLLKFGVTASTDLGMDVARLVASEVGTWVAIRVGQMVLTRLGVSGGILGAAAASSWWSFGATLVIGLGVDYVVGWLTDPSDKIRARLEADIDRLHGLIVNGDGGQPGLKEYLRRLSQARAQLRRQALGAMTNSVEKQENAS